MALGRAGASAADHELRVGDVLFQELPGPVRDLSLHGAGGASFAHCALLTRLDGAGGSMVTEALYPRVRATVLSVFLSRSLDRDGCPAVVVARLRRPYRHLIDRAVSWADAHVGVPYDECYLPGGDALYCSELIVCAFRAANDGVDVFPEAPISFRCPSSGELQAAWRQHFARLGIEVPEGVLGSGPATLSRSPALEVVHRMGGWPTPLAAAAPAPLVPAMVSP
jgi:hypothetical protein